MSKMVVDIHGEIEGDYEIIKKYEERQWIPVNERLPKDYVPVMISTHHSVFPEARYSKKYGWQWAYSSDQGDWRKFEEQRVIAWMPLPEPYK